VLLRAGRRDNKNAPPENSGGAARKPTRLVGRPSNHPRLGPSVEIRACSGCCKASFLSARGALHTGRSACVNCVAVAMEFALCETPRTPKTSPRWAWLVNRGVAGRLQISNHSRSAGSRYRVSSIEAAWSRSAEASTAF